MSPRIWIHNTRSDNDQKRARNSPRVAIERLLATRLLPGDYRLVTVMPLLTTTLYTVTAREDRVLDRLSSSDRESDEMIG